MRYLYLAAAVPLILYTPASAEMSRSTCEVIQGPVNRAADSSNGYKNSIEAIDFNAMSKAFSGDVRLQMEKLGTTKQKLVPLLQEFVTGLQDLGYELRRCAR